MAEPVEGPDGAGTAITRPPVQVGGRDATGKLRAVLVGADGSLTLGTVTVTGGLTDAQLRAAAVPVSLATAPTTPVTGTFWQATQPVSVASLPSSASTIVDGGDVTQGAVADAAWSGSGNSTLVAALKAIYAKLAGTLTTTTSWASAQHVIVDTAPTTAVTIASLPALATGSNVIGHVILDSGTTAATQSGTWTVQPGNTANTTAWKVDGSAVTQPVSGTVTANAGSGPFPVSDNSGSLTVDAPVATPVFVRLSDGSAAIATLPVSLASLPALAAGSAVIGHVIVDSGAVTVTNATAANLKAAATLDAETTKVIGTVNVSSGQSVALAAGTAEIGNVKNSGTFAVQAAISGSISNTSFASTVADGASVALGTTTDAAVGDATGTLNAHARQIAKLLGASLTINSPAVTNAGTFAVQQTKPATSTTSSVSISTSATVLAANAARYGATVYNESGAILYLKLGATASITDYTLQVAIGGYYETPSSYTGILTGVTSSGTAVVRVDEITT